MTEDTSEVNCRDKKTDSAIETITRAQQMKIEAHYKAEAREAGGNGRKERLFYVLLKTLGLTYLKCVQQEFL